MRDALIGSKPLKEFKTAIDRSQLVNIFSTCRENGFLSADGDIDIVKSIAEDELSHIIEPYVKY